MDRLIVQAVFQLSVQVRERLGFQLASILMLLRQDFQRAGAKGTVIEEVEIFRQPPS